LVNQIDIAFHFLASTVSQATVRRTATHIFYLEDDLYNTNSYLGWIDIYGIRQPLEKHLCETPCDYSDVLSTTGRFFWIGLCLGKATDGSLRRGLGSNLNWEMNVEESYHEVG